MNRQLAVRRLRQYIEAQLKNNCASFGEHPLGLSLFNKDQNLHFVMIPKNASTSISVVALNSKNDKWVPVICSATQNSKHIVILRDPVERFISAANMFLTTGKEIFAGLPLIINNKLVTTDCHFQPQHKFISNLSLESVDFFWYSNTVVQDIKQFYNLDFKNLNLNVSTKLINQVDNELIKTLYAKDYELINSVKFVNMPQ